MFEYSSRDHHQTQDGLFLERLESFMDKCLADIRAFSEREHRSFEETRRQVAEWHAKYLFNPQLSIQQIGTERTEQVRTILRDASHTLESLSETAGVQSFILAVDPTNTSDPAFLGGSVMGREFWRNLRGGGESGAQTFSLQSRRELGKLAHATPDTQHSITPQPQTAPFKGNAKSLKTELYESVRKALRNASGMRNAEMKWANPERLDAFGVRVVGWPAGIPAQNPSTLKLSQNRELLEALQSGSLRFERTRPPTEQEAETAKAEGMLDQGSPGADEDEDFSWAYDADAADTLMEGSSEFVWDASSSAGRFDLADKTVTRAKKRPRSEDLEVVEL